MAQCASCAASAPATASTAILLPSGVVRVWQSWKSGTTTKSYPPISQSTGVVVGVEVTEVVAVVVVCVDVAVVVVVGVVDVVGVVVVVGVDVAVVVGVVEHGLCMLATLKESRLTAAAFPPACIELGPDVSWASSPQQLKWNTLFFGFAMKPNRAACSTAPSFDANNILGMFGLCR